MDLAPEHARRLARRLGATVAAELAAAASLQQAKGVWRLMVDAGKLKRLPPLGAALDALAEGETPVAWLSVYGAGSKDGAASRFGDAALEELLASPAAAGLKVLDLAAPPLTVKGASALAKAALPALRELHLGHATFGPAGVAALCAGPGLAGLERLNLYSVELGKAGGAALAGAPFARSIKLLDLFFTQLGPAGAAALAGGRYPRLEALLVWASELGDAGAKALAGAGPLPRLVTLDVGRNAIGDAGLKALAVSQAFPRCKTVRLAENDFGDAGLGALAASKGWPALREVDVSACDRVTLKGLERLVFSEALASLQGVTRSLPTPADWPQRSGRRLRVP